MEVGIGNFGCVGKGATGTTGVAVALTRIGIPALGTRRISRAGPGALGVGVGALGAAMGAGSLGAGVKLGHDIGATGTTGATGEAALVFASGTTGVAALTFATAFAAAFSVQPGT